MTSSATFKAAELIAEEESRLAWETVEDEEPQTDLEFEEKLKLVWKLYIPAGTAALGTVAAIIMLNKVGARQAAAATALYTITDKAFSEYKDKVVEKIGETKEQTVRDDIAQDNVTKNPPREVILTGNGDVLCYDTITGRYFQSNVESIRRAENDINSKILHEMYATLSDFYELIGLNPTPYSDDIGWNADELMSMSFSTVLSDDNRPCISVDYRVVPIKGYDRLV